MYSFAFPVDDIYVMTLHKRSKKSQFIFQDFIFAICYLRSWSEVSVLVAAPVKVLSNCCMVEILFSNATYMPSLKLEQLTACIKQAEKRISQKAHSDAHLITIKVGVRSINV